MKSNRRRGCGKSTGGKFAFPPTLCVSLSQQMFSGVFDRRLKLCGMVHGSQCQVAESKQAVVGVLDIQLIVSPVTVETTFSAPEAVDKIKYLLDHEDERLAIADAGKQRTLTQHTVAHRCEKVHEVICATMQSL